MKPQKQVSDIPNAADRHLWQIQPLRDLTWILIIFLLFWLGYAMREVTVPLLVAILLTYLFAPVVSVLERRLRFPRPLAAGTILGVGGFTVLLALALTVPVVVSQTASFVDAVRRGKYDNAIERLVDLSPDSVQPQIESFVARGQSWLGISTAEDRDVSASDTAAGSTTDESSTVSAKASDVPSEASGSSSIKPNVIQVAGEAPSDGESGESIASTASTAASVLSDDRIRMIVREELSTESRESASDEAKAGGGKWYGWVGSGARRAWNIVLGSIHLGILIFLIPFYFFYFTVMWPRMVAFFQGMIVESHRDHALYLLGEMDNAVSGFVRGRIVIAFILAIMYSVGWTIVGVPYALPLGLLIGCFTLVPYLGGIGLPLSIGLMAADQYSLVEAERMAWWGIILWPTLVYLICQFADDYALTPLIAGRATNLDPVSIVVAILAGGALAGLYGMLIAIPVAACIKILLREVFMPRIRQWVDGTVDDPLPIEE
ncbi:MAG: hypothetical protein CMJ53_02920 [Planctomycetaceae bacterium]|nr:hypothetical protein [Planctomycetaceae bacterium]